MRNFRSLFSMMLILFFILTSLVNLAATHPPSPKHLHRILAGRDAPTLTIKYPIPAKVKISSPYASPCVGAHCANATPLAPSQLCDAANGTTFVSQAPNGMNYTLICDIDFPAQNIYPVRPGRLFRRVPCTM